MHTTRDSYLSHLRVLHHGRNVPCPAMQPEHRQTTRWPPNVAPSHKDTSGPGTTALPDWWVREKQVAPPSARRSPCSLCECNTRCSTRSVCVPRIYCVYTADLCDPPSLPESPGPLHSGPGAFPETAYSLPRSTLPSLQVPRPPRSPSAPSHGPPHPRKEEVDLICCWGGSQTPRRKSRLVARVLRGGLGRHLSPQ